MCAPRLATKRATTAHRPRARRRVGTRRRATAAAPAARHEYSCACGSPPALMGVPRLLVLLAGVATQVKVGQRCRSARLGIDLFGWLHQAVVNHYDSLVVQKPPDYRPVVDEVLHYLLAHTLRF